MFKGAITALVTPFKDGKVDEQAFQDFVQWQIEQGIHGLVPCGTTGESPTLTHDEHNRVIALCIEVAHGRTPIIAGAGSNATHEAISLAKHAEEAGADAILVATPYYNKPNQEGLYQHYKAINDSVDTPIILYNIPGRSVIDMQDATTARLAKLANVVGIKDATGDLSRVTSLKKELGEDAENFCILSGDDETAVAFDTQGGVGCISVTSNIFPDKVAKIQQLCIDGHHTAAAELQDELMNVHMAMFCDSSPAPAKYAASLMGKMNNELRLPLVALAADKEEIVKHALKEQGLDV